MNDIVKAINDFHRLRRRAIFDQILARLTGRSTDLLSFEDVRRRVKANQQIELGLRDVPLDAIVGSVGRYKDFTRTFLPKDSASEQRWAKVKTLNLDLTGLPPVDLYKIGDVYFVLDGNHRVSVAREMGLKKIQAYVTELLTRVPLGPETSPDTLIIAEEYADFLEKTELDRLRPNVDLRMSAPGKFSVLLNHIEIHRYFMGLDFQRDISWQEAVTHWVDSVYLPVIELIADYGLLNDFPDRTPTDLYVWIGENQAAFEEKLGWELSLRETVEAVSDFGRPGIGKLSQQIWDAYELYRDLDEVDPVAEVSKTVTRQHLFAQILVSLGNRGSGQPALEQALLIAQREGGRIRGVHHFYPEGSSFSPDSHDDSVHHVFDERLRDFGVTGRMVDVTGDWVEAMTERSRWADLVVMSIHRPPDEGLLARPAEWRQILSAIQRPVMMVPQQASPLSRALVAYNGAGRSREALTVAGYLAIRWGIDLVVTSIGKPSTTEGHLQEARRFLETFGVQASYVAVEGKVKTNLLVTMASHDCDFLIMGGSMSSPLRDLFVDGSVAAVMRNISLPVLICQ